MLSMEVDRLRRDRTIATTSVRSRGHGPGDMARNPADDERIFVRLGVAISKAQLLEVVLVKLVEAQRLFIAVG